jgi:hypothetical protein
VSPVVDLLGLIASAATAFGVVMAWWQVREARRQAVTSFEDSMSREYRDIAQKLPVAALLGDPLSEEELTSNLDDFYHYIDLTNEQVFLRQRGRVRADTWANWRDGIQTNLSRPAFRAAWERIKEKAPNSFEELRRLEAERYGSDPRKWKD